MFSLPLLLYGERVHLCLLKPHQTANHNKHFEFIAQGRIGKSINLFRILTSTQLLNLSNRGKRDFNLNTEFSLTYKILEDPIGGGKTLEVTVVISPEKRLNAPEFVCDDQRSSSELSIAGGQFSFSNDHNPFKLVPSKDQLRNDIVFEASPSMEQELVKKVRITFNFQPDPSHPVVYSDTIIIHVARTESNRDANIYRVILDFGSEASQLGLIAPNSRKLERIDLVGEMAQAFHPTLTQVTQDPHAYYQRDHKDYELFKSHVFVKRNGGKSRLNEAPQAMLQGGVDREKVGMSLSDTRELVSVLTSKNIKDLLTHRFLAPNLKLAILKDFFNESISFDAAEDNPAPNLNTRCSFMDFMGHEIHLHRIVINKLLHGAFRHIRNKLHPSQKPYIHLSLLVPNVYDQKIISRLLKNLHADMGESLELYGFEGCEISILSESDAAFCGMVSENQLTELEIGDHYLVVDGGKGTIDYSIIRIDKRGDSDKIQKYTSRYRSGKVGAGNVISFGFIETVLAVLLGDPSPQVRHTFMREHLIMGENSQLDEILAFLSLVEELKVRYSQAEKYDKLRPIEVKKREGLIDYDKAPTLSLSVINNRIKHIFNIGKTESDFDGATIFDEYGWIEDAAESVVGGIFSEIKQLCLSKKKSLKFKKILFAGRAFKFSLLETKFREHFQSLCEGKEPHSIVYSDNPKHICLYGAVNKTVINYNSTLVGVPFVLGKGDKGFFNGMGGATHNGTKRKRELGNGKDVVGKIKSWLKRWEEWLFASQEEGYQLSPLSQENDAFANIDLPFFLHGSKEIKMGSEVLLNGFTFRNPIEEMHSQDYRLLFDGEDFQARVLEKGDIVSNEPLRETFRDRSKIDGMLIKTVFPFIQTKYFDELELSPYKKAKAAHPSFFSAEEAEDLVAGMLESDQHPNEEPGNFFAAQDIGGDTPPADYDLGMDLMLVGQEEVDKLSKEESTGQKEVVHRVPPQKQDPDDDDHILSLG